MEPIITKYPNGNICVIEYFNDNGKSHRTDGPAYQYFYENGNIEIEQWYINGKKHRTNGPAKIYFYENGNIELEQWYINGKYHRTDGPAIITYHENGYIIEEYFIDGKELSKQQFIIHNRKRKLEIINETENN